MLKKFGFAALVAAAALAFALGSATTGEAKGKKAAAPQPLPCFSAPEPVCGTKGGQSFTYANACSAEKDGATVVANHACAAKMHKAKKHKAMKAKPAKKAAKKKK